MEFSEKYELIQSVTTGAVESFIGNNKIRGERVLVHILQCEPQKPNQPTVQWVLEGFHKLAPEPAGIVLETGRYSGTTYAYLITTLPGDAELAAWVGRYNARNRGTEELDAAAARPAAQNQMPPVAPQPTSVPPAQVPVQFTQIFREVHQQAKPAVSNPQEEQPPTSPALSTDLPGRPIPSFNAERFPSGPQAAPKWNDLATSPPLPDQEPRLAGTPPGSGADSASKSEPSNALPSNTHDAARPGEFTSFWQGPFRADRLAEIPKSSSSPLETQDKPGEFTLMFRSGAAPPEAPAFSPTSPEQDRLRSGLTGWSTHAEIMAQTPPEPVPLIKPVEQATPVIASPPKQPSLTAQPATPPQGSVSPRPPVFPVPTPPKSATVPLGPGPHAASSAFQPPSAGTIPPVEPIPAAPGAYTQIISVKPLPAEQTPAEENAAPKLPSFAAASKPAAPLPKLPPLPKAPAIRTPKVPKLNTPNLGAEKSAVSYWPMVLTLTALFFIAVLLVLYFVLKH